MHAYEKNPTQIYDQSFAIIRNEARLDGFNASERDVVIRMIHACGMVELADNVVISPDAIENGRAALLAGNPIICDVEMVRRGIITRHLTGKNEVLCNIGSDVAVQLAATHETTRSAAAIESLADQLNGAVVVIGNAPTALFHLLDLIENGAEHPALIIGCPVGFVGASESKQALIKHQNAVPYITVKGRIGGSAIAAAALNAVGAGLSI